MSANNTLDAVHAEATPVPGVEKITAAELQMLDGDEIVQLSMKPSLWYIPLASFQFVLAMALLASALTVILRHSWSLTLSIALQFVVFLAVARVAVAALQWASRHYVLTNRRVMRFRGILTVDVSQCLLKRVSAVDLQATGPQRALRIGSIRLSSLDEPPAVVGWECVARPAEVHQLLVAAVRKAQSGT